MAKDFIVGIAIGAFSAALCRGLIEAASRAASAASLGVFSAALCRGLIEALVSRAILSGWIWVFRGFMPRPH